MLLNWTAQPLLQLQINIARVLEKVVLLFHGGFAWVFAALLLCAIAGAVRLGLNVLERQDSRAEENPDRPGVFADIAGRDAAGVGCRAVFPGLQ